MLILAFAVLAMGGLQLASLRTTQSAANFSTAATLAKEYTEMMRSNPTIANSTATSAPLNPYLFDSSNTSTFAVSPSADCKANACSTTDISRMHVADWASRVAAQLPGGKAVVCRDAAGSYSWTCPTTGTVVTIKIGWIDKRDSEERGTVAVSATPGTPQFVITGLTGLQE